jgi:thiol:disulfide interchange protein DsbA
MSKLNRRTLVLAAASLPALAPLLAPSRARAQGGAPVELRDFTVLKPAQPTDSGAKIEVLEFFQYSCPHCYSFHPDLVAWKGRQGDAVDFKRIPINWDAATVNHTKTYYALEQLKRLDDLHEMFFAVIHTQRQRMLNASDIAKFMTTNGIPADQWNSAFNSFSVNARASRAGQIWRAYKVEGTPAIGIDGKFLTSPSMVGTRQGALAVMDFLVARARRERGGAPAAPAAKK